jgi:hypothetical protein
MLAAMLLLVSALSVSGVQLGSRASNSLLRTRSTPRARVLAGQMAEPSNEKVPVPPTIGGEGWGEGLDESQIDFATTEELSDMKLRVMEFQAEIDEKKTVVRSEEMVAEEEGAGGLLGVGLTVPEFMVGAIKSIPQYEVPLPAVLLKKVAFSFFGLIFFYLLVEVVDGVLLEALRPIVKWQVDRQPML